MSDNNYKFTIDNYQIIKHGEINFKNGITLIVGSSNNGKSSIFKAFKQLIYNLSGNNYINQSSDKCRLKLDLNDNTYIEYIKYKNKSLYNIKSNENINTLEKLGVNQINDIKNLSNIDKNKDYNFWNQMDKPFLLSKNNREQFTMLQESPISNNLLNIQDNIKSDIKSKKDNILINQGKLDIISSNILKFNSILEYTDLSNNFINNVNNLNNINTKILNINNNLNELNKITEKLNKISIIKDININYSNDIFNSYKSITDLISKLVEINSKMNSNINNINILETKLNSLESFKNNNFKICPVCGNSLDNHKINIEGEC